MKNIYIKRGIWFIVIGAILFNAYVTITLFQDGVTYDLHKILPWLFRPFDNIRYGNYLAKRFFLPGIAFIILIFQAVRSKKVVSFIHQNVLSLIIIFFVLLITRIFSFGHWFYLDDYTFLAHWFAHIKDLQIIPCCAEGYPAMGVMYLVMRWFGTNFYLYNTLGFFTLFLTGIVLFMIASKIQNNKTISLLASIFFLTLPTYFHMTMAVQEFTGDGFSLLLFVTSVYLLLSSYIPEALIFAAAALEFGLSRTYFISLPLLFIYSFVKRNKWGGLLFLLISLPYIPVLGTRAFAHGVSVISSFSSSRYFMDLGNIIPQITIPYEILRPLFLMLNWFFDKFVYLTPSIGALIILFLIFMTWISHLKRNVTTTRLFILGIFIILSSVIFPPLFGVRIDVLEKSVKNIINSPTPTQSTAYGLFPAVGLFFIFLAFSLTTKKSMFLKIVILLIIINSLTVMKSDIIWNNDISKRQKTINNFLTKVLPKDGKPKIIYIPKGGYINRSITNFLTISLPNENVLVTEDLIESGNLVKTYNVTSDHFFELKYDPDTDILVKN